MLGVSMLVNLGGNNTYEAHDVAQGSALAGVGILDRLRRPTTAIAASAACKARPSAASASSIGRGGKNDYHAAMWAQGFGGPLGFGLLDNVDGNNHYYCGGMWRIPIPKPPATRAGARASAAASARWPTAASA